jgi:hypothetical protein
LVEVERVRSYISLRKPQGKSLVSLLTLVLFLFVSALASSSGLHEFFHQDSTSSQHHCAATLLSNGKVDAAPVITSVPVPVVLTLDVGSAEILPLVSNRSSLPPGRGPPQSLA